VGSAHPTKTEVLQSVLHAIGTQGPAQVEQPADHISKGALLGNDDAGMVVPLVHPLVVQPREVGDVERDQGAPLPGAPHQLGKVALADAMRFGRGERIETRGPQAMGDVAIDVLVREGPDRRHAG
jgi:hypothetical protein